MLWSQTDYGLCMVSVVSASAGLVLNLRYAGRIRPLYLCMQSKSDKRVKRTRATFSDLSLK